VLSWEKSQALVSDFTIVGSLFPDYAHDQRFERRSSSSDTARS